MMTSTGSGFAFFTTITLGSGAPRRCVGAMSFTLSNQKRVSRDSTSPLNGMVPSTWSKALTRSVVTMTIWSPRA